MLLITNLTTLFQTMQEKTIDFLNRLLKHYNRMINESINCKCTKVVPKIVQMSFLNVNELLKCP